MNAMPLTVISPMTREEAEHHTAQCKYHADKLREHIAIIHEREGWRALEYDSFEAWAENELQQGYKWALKLKNAYVIQQELVAELDSPQGDVDHLPTKHAEQLNKLPDAPSRASAYQTAMNLAAAEGGTVATRHVKQAVDRVRSEVAVRESAYPVVAHMMDAGDVTPTVARQMVDKLEQLPPQQNGFVLGIIGAHGLTTADLIPRLASLADRPDSKMLPEVRMGYLNGKLLKDANLTDWDAAAEEARKEHVSDKREEKLQRERIEAKIVTVYTTDEGDVRTAARRTLRALQRELPQHLMKELYVLMQGEYSEGYNATK